MMLMQKALQQALTLRGVEPSFDLEIPALLLQNGARVRDVALLSLLDHTLSQASIANPMLGVYPAAPPAAAAWS